jgi:hypothetical protein
VERALGLPNAVVDPEYKLAVKNFMLTNIIDDQINYHRRNFFKARQVEHNLRALGERLFFLTVFICVIELSVSVVGRMAKFEGFLQTSTHGLFAISGFCTAMGTAILGIRNVGEFLRLERRSHAVASALEDAKRTLKALPVSGALTRDLLAPVMERVAVQFMSETAEWRTIVISHRLEAS